MLAASMLACSNPQDQSKEAAPIIPMQDFFRNPENAYFSLSPDGKKIAFTKPVNQRMNIFCTVIGSGDTIQLTNFTDRDVQAYFWKGDKIVYVKDKGGDENFHLYVVGSNGLNQKDLTPFEKVNVQIIDDLELHDDQLLIGINKDNPQLFDAYQLNLATDSLTLEARNPGGVSQWITDHNGNLRVAVQSDGVNSVILHRANKNEPFKSVLRTTFKEGIQPLVFTADNKDLFALSNLNRDKMALVRFDIVNGKELEVLYEHPQVDINDIEYSKVRKVITSAECIVAKPERHFFDSSTAKIYADLQQQLGKQDEIIITGHNQKEDLLLVRTISDRSLGATYLYEVGSKKLEKIAERAPWLVREQLCEMKPVSYKAKDGLTVHGYLTTPKGVEAKNLPVVINPHGGPWARDEWGWNPEVQFLANRGYAVLQINFRGSTGYGRAFWEAGFKEWGKKMQQDITDGVEWLIKEGIADPKRVGIYGASYGGYATLSGITFTPELYACAVDYVGVSNLFTFMKTVPPYWAPFMQMMYEMVGDPVKDSVLLHEASPVFFVDKIKAPLFIAQGANDPRVNKAESDQIVEALKKRGVKVEYMVKDNEGHGFSNEENQFEFYGAMEKFLAMHLGGKIAQPSAVNP
jgi:dipeptidyl aminopeptidase/acylaminoacyl peptidase